MQKALGNAWIIKMYLFLVVKDNDIGTLGAM